ncbi:hypothetical protein [uncultured Bacteroides sp.]|uniref:hypothetical protein n=1 Tax=uncultured Bacteroides sp. TaxID=162156 RepID=UPI002AAC4AD5|nr:hypothetical protein [uncultured Bacteroides sp.]
MSISKTKLNYLTALSLVTILTSVVGWIIFYLFFPEHFFKWYAFIPTFFVLLGIFSISMFDACRKYAPKRLVQCYMALKILRLIFSIIILLIYCVAIALSVKEFLITFMVFYVVNLVFETWFFFSFEVNQKRRKKHEKENIS